MTNINKQDPAMGFKTFALKILGAAGLGIVVALIPSAIFSALIKPFITNPYVMQLSVVLNIMVICASLLVGILGGLFVGLNPMKAVSVGMAAFIASGVVGDVTVQLANGATRHIIGGFGTGDLINAILVTGISAAVLKKIGNFFGSMEIIFIPIIGGCLIGFLGLFVLPYVKLISIYLAQMVRAATDFTPLIMSFVIGASFSVIIVSPVSSVVIAYAIGATGLVSGAANLGVVGASFALLINSVKVNKVGVSATLGIGAVKMMVSNLIHYPVLMLPLALTGGLTGLGAYFFDIQGTTASAGFGQTGLVGPLAAWDTFVSNPGLAAMPLVNILVSYLLIPAVAAFVVDLVLRKILKLYDLKIFVFDPTKA